MSVEAPTRNVGGDDGSGKDSDWKAWEREVTGGVGYEVEDIGRDIFTGRTALSSHTTGAFAPNFQTDRVMPIRPNLRPRRFGTFYAEGQVGLQGLQRVQRSETRE